MDWGSAITYLGSTTLKERTVQFGIKDADRLKHLCVLGRSDSGRGNLLVQMALQDIERGIGTIILDASGKIAPLLIERIDPSFSNRIVHLDPSSAEYPYAWNPLDDIRALPKEIQQQYLIALLLSIYQLERSSFVEYIAELLLTRSDATLVTIHTLVTDEKAREVFFENNEKEKKEFETHLSEDQEVLKILEESGRYIAKDTLVRNLLGQPTSKFQLQKLTEGAIVVVDFSHIKIFPTRMTPLVRSFTDVARMVGEHLGSPVSLYLHDCLRYLGEDEIDRVFSSKQVAVTVADTVLQESDRERREFAISRCGSIASFTTHPADKAVIERAFYPYADAEELNRLGKGELIVALTIDAVRARPFFAKTTQLPEKKHTSYQDLVLEARNKYTVSRLEVDALFKKQRGEKEPPRKRDGGGFQDAFRSIMENRAQKMPIDVGKGGSTAKASDAKKEPPTRSTEKSAPEKTETEKIDDKKQPDEIPEDTLKKLLYVRPALL